MSEITRFVIGLMIGFVPTFALTMAALYFFDRHRRKEQNRAISCIRTEDDLHVIGDVVFSQKHSARLRDYDEPMGM